MKIKRFFATDIRQAMKMVKDELGADAVIMSNRAVEGGIEIVAARDFDEQTIHTKLQEHVSAQTPEAKIQKVTFPSFETAKELPQAKESLLKFNTPSIPKESFGQQKASAKTEEPMAEKPAHPAPKRIVLPNFEAARKRLQLENEMKAAEALAKAQPARKFTSPYVGYAEKAQLIKSTEALAASSAAAPIVKKPEVTAPTPSTQEKQSNFTDNLLLEMSKELKSLRATVDNKLTNISWAHNPQPASVRNDLMQRLLDIGISKRLSAMVASQLADENDVEPAFNKAQEILSQALPIADDELLEKGGIVALVGPTGVGKTTTIAKLAAKFILKNGSKQVALITTDNYRIGAHEQLNTYGRILNIPVRVASCADDLRNLINNFSDKRLILIDTAGMCQRDMKLVEQINTLQQSGLPIKPYLVMSAATEYKAMKEVIRAFSVFEPQAAILTKLDEAVTVGPAVSSIIEHNLPLSFITNGQQVPEDFHHPEAHSLISQCVVTADDEAEDDTHYQSWGAQAYA